MIIGLLLSAMGVTILLWITLMFMWWQKENGKEAPLARETTVSYFEKCVRIVRRGWYACGRYLRSAGMWGNKKMARAFFSLFPSAAPAFAKRDELAGLTHGPSSYFLLSISQNEPIPMKKSAGRRKIV